MNIKEYLNPKDWSLHLGNVDNDAAGKDWIEVPDGAEYLLRHKDDGDELFFKEDFNLMSTTDQDGDWFLSNFDKYIGDKIGYMIENYQSEVLWQRHTQPESLPFIDDEPSVQETLKERQSSYGCFEDVALVTENIIDALKQVNYSKMPKTHKMAMYMIASKMARIVNGDFNHKDSWHDIQGYARLIENLINGNNNG